MPLSQTQRALRSALRPMREQRNQAKPMSPAVLAIVPTVAFLCLPSGLGIERHAIETAQDLQFWQLLQEVEDRCIAMSCKP